MKYSSEEYNIIKAFNRFFSKFKLKPMFKNSHSRGIMAGIHMMDDEFYALTLGFFDDKGNRTQNALSPSEFRSFMGLIERVMKLLNDRYGNANEPYLFVSFGVENNDRCNSFDGSSAALRNFNAHRLFIVNDSAVKFIIDLFTHPALRKKLIKASGVSYIETWSCDEKGANRIQIQKTENEEKAVDPKSSYAMTFNQIADTIGVDMDKISKK